MDCEKLYKTIELNKIKLSEKEDKEAALTLELGKNDEEWKENEMEIHNLLER